MMPIIYASCIAKRGKLVGLFVYLRRSWGEKKATQSCYQERSFTNLYL